MKKSGKSYEWMIGKEFGRLKILSFADFRENFNKGIVRKIPYFIVECSCGKKFEAHAGHVKSGHTNSCGCYRKELFTGEGNPNYNPNLLMEERKGKRGYAVERWATAVKRRDNFTCQVCGSKEKIIAHHINSYKSDKENRYNVENGITLCRECHTDFHCNFMGDYRQPCNEEDFEQYLLQV